MDDPSEFLVFDSGPLSHFSQHSWLGVLKAVAGSRRVFVPESVHREMSDASDEYPHLRAVLEADWIERASLDSVLEIAAFTKYAERLMVGRKNEGECGVLAFAQVNRCLAVIDDHFARTIGEDEGVRVTGTLALLCQGIREGLLTVSLVSSLADDLLAGEYFLPFGQGGFARWADEEGLVR